MTIEPRTMTKEAQAADPILRSAKDEEHDVAERSKNIAATAFHDWPNEAGFEGLEEEQGPVELWVSGEIPAWAAGSLYRTGPGIWKVENTPKGTVYISHWFDGLAQSHRFEIAPTEGHDGSNNVKVFYSSRRQSHALMARIQREGGINVFTFGQRQDPCVGVFSKAMSTWQALSQKTPEEDNVAVTVMPNLPSTFKPSAKIENGASPAKNRKDVPARSGHRAGLPQNVWLTTDSAAMKQIDPETLEPIGYAKQSVLHPSLTGPMSCAHGQRDPATGDFFSFNLSFGRTPTYRVFRVSGATGKTDILATIAQATAKPAYIHSFYLTPSFVILCIPSTHLGMNGLKVTWNRNYTDSFVPFSPENKSQWFVIDRLHGRGVVAEFQTDAGFFFHSVNSFEEEDDEDRENGTVTVNCDTIEYDNYDVIPSFNYDVMLNRDAAADQFWASEEKGRAAATHLNRYRFRVPRVRPAGEGPATGRAKLTATKAFSIPAPHSGELPTINPRFATRPHRFVYSLPSRGRSTLFDGLVKTDLHTREALFWNNPQGHTPGEAIFVPRPDGEDEDDGVLLSVVLDGHARTSYLLCLDARTMRELGRAEVGLAVGFGFHGVHSPPA